MSGLLQRFFPDASPWLLTLSFLVLSLAPAPTLGACSKANGWIYIAGYSPKDACFTLITVRLTKLFSPNATLEAMADNLLRELLVPDLRLYVSSFPSPLLAPSSVPVDTHDFFLSRRRLTQKVLYEISSPASATDCHICFIVFPEARASSISGRRERRTLLFVRGG